MSVTTIGPLSRRLAVLAALLMGFALAAVCQDATARVVIHYSYHGHPYAGVHRHPPRRRGYRHYHRPHRPWHGRRPGRYHGRYGYRGRRPYHGYRHDHWRGGRAVQPWYGPASPRQRREPERRPPGSWGDSNPRHGTWADGS